jgi:hypothetical protein
MLPTVDMHMEEGVPLMCNYAVNTDCGSFEMAPIHNAKSSFEAKAISSGHGSPSKNTGRKDRQDLTDRIVLSVYDRGDCAFFLSVNYRFAVLFPCKLQHFPVQFLQAFMMYVSDTLLVECVVFHPSLPSCLQDIGISLVTVGTSLTNVQHTRILIISYALSLKMCRMGPFCPNRI